MRKLVYILNKDVFILTKHNEKFICNNGNMYLLNLNKKEHRKIAEILHLLKIPRSKEELTELLPGISPAILEQYLLFIQSFITIKNVEARILLIGETKITYLLEEKLLNDRCAVEKYQNAEIANEELLTSRIHKNDFIIISQNLQISPLYEKINNICAREKKSILNISYDSVGIIFGPYIKTSTPFCYRCYKKRMKLNYLNREYITLGDYYSNATFNDSEFQYLLSMDNAIEAAQIIKEFIYNKKGIMESFNASGIYYYNFNTIKERNFDIYKVYAIPGCELCDKDEIVDLYEEKQLISKEETSSIPLSFIHKQAGIFRRLIDAKTILKGTNIYYYTIQVPSIYEAMNSDGFSTKFQYNIAGGVSVNKKVALGKAIGEACERYCLEAYNKEKLISYSLKEIRDMGLDYLKDLQLFADWQYVREGFIYKKPKDDLQILWTTAKDFVRNVKILVPASFVYTRYGKQQDTNCIGRLTTSGAACSTEFENAMLYAILELFERDSTMITWLQKLNIPKVLMNIKKLKNKRLINILKILEDNEITTEIFYITLDLELPCFLVLGNSKNELLPENLIGAGCRLNAEDALIRALEEIIQGCGWTKLHKDIKFFNPGEYYENVTGFQERVSLYARKEMKKHLNFLKNTDKTIYFDEIPSFDCNEEEAFKKCLSIIKKNNLSLLVKDLTTTDIRKLGFVVVKVLIPELQQIEADYNYRILNNSRVYEVPGKLGYKTANNSKELNTVPHPFP